MAKKAATKKSSTKATTRKKAARQSWFSRNRNLTIFIILFAAVGGFLLYRSFAASNIIGALQGEDMTITQGSGSVVKDGSASGNQALELTSGNAVASGTLTIQGTDPGVKLALIARADQCNGSPTVNVSVSGVSVLTTDLTSAGWIHYPETDQSITPGNHPVVISISNFNKTASCATNVYIDLIRVHASTSDPSGGDNPVPYQVTTNKANLPSNLIFDDEFNGNSLDTTSWAPVWYNDGATQNGTVMKASNVSVSGGYLNLSNSGNTGGLVSSNPKVSAGQSDYKGFQYSTGYAEARICLPAASDGQIANWPAWWTDGQTWPGNGEQDIMEGLGGSAAAHWHGRISTNSGVGYGNGGHLTGCHIFASLWKSGTVNSYYDGQYVGTYSSSEIVTDPQYLILENSSGQWGHQPVTNNTTVKVDYVRVWQ